LQYNDNSIYLQHKPTGVSAGRLAETLVESAFATAWPLNF